MLIVYGGAFNPLTAAHQAAIRTLSQRYPGAQIILLPSGEQFVKLWKPDQDVLPDVIRLDILSAFVRESGLTNVQIDTLAMARNLCTYDALHELKKKYHQDDARFVIGMDKLPELPRWAHAETLLRECTFILLAYADDQPDLPAGARIETLLLPVGTEDIHASALRNRMARHDPTVAQEPLVGPVLSRYPECLRLCALSPRVHLGDPQANAQAIIQRAQQMDGDVLVFPELSICGYTCGDLFVSPVFVRACLRAAGRVMRETADTGKLIVIGCPVPLDERLFNCALAFCGGRLIAAVPKTHLANYSEFYERRWFAGADEAVSDQITLFGQTAPFGTDVLLEQDESLTPQQRRELLRSVNEEARWLMRITENLLSITRIDGENASVKKTPELMEEVMEGAVSKFQRHYHSIPVQVHLPKEPLLVPMDPLLMQQVLFNLMENAARHGETVTQIDITLTREEERAVLEVADNGVGIASDRLHTLFDGTQQPEEGREDAHRDMGIGLSVCRTIVSAHGGTITAKNRKEGGALFRITLPLK